MRRLLASKTIHAVALGGGISACTGSAMAAALSWNNAAGGVASTAGNWSPVQVPTSADDLTFNMAGIYGVTFNSSTTTSRTQAFRQGTVTLTMSSPHTTSNGVAIADLNGDTSTVTLTTGAWSSGPSGFANIGDAAGTNGTLNVNDDDADFVVLGTSDLFIGNNGTGTMNVTNAGSVVCSDLMHIGQGSAATGTLLVTGAPAIAPFGRSTLNVNGTGESRWGNGGDATISVTNGALSQFEGGLSIANLSTSVTSVTVGGSGGLGGILDATLDVAGDLSIARNTLAGVLPGTGTLTVNGSGRVIAGLTLNIGNDFDGGGSGTLTLNSGSFVSAQSVDQGPQGTINHIGGTLQINGGSYAGHADPLVVSGTGNPTLQFSGGAVKNLIPAGTVGLIVGDDLGAGSFSGNLQIDSGADVILVGTSKDINIGEDAGASGTITVDGAGSRLIANQPGDDIRVGNNGTGTLHILNGGQVLANNVLVPAISSATGTLLLDDANSSLTTANLTVGHASGTGSGSVVDDAPTTINATSAGISVLIRSTGFIAITGTLNATGTVLVQGDLNVHGTVTAGTLVDVDSGGRLQAGAGTANAVVDAPVRVRSGGVLNVISDDLEIGDATASNGVQAEDGSLVNVGTSTLIVNDANRAVFDDVTIAGGEIIAPNGMEIFTPGTNGTLTGTGTITTSELFMESGGSVITATGSNGITINGKFRNNSGLIDGTKYTFTENPAISDSGWTGAGTIAAKVVFDEGTKVNALANMTMGDGTITGVAFGLGSELHADTRNVTLLDTSGVNLGSVTDVNGGRVICAAPLSVVFGRRLSGRGGSIDSPNVLINGILSPGELVGVPLGDTGQLTINGDLELQANAQTNIQIQGLLGPIQYDSVVVNGVATLGGELNLSIINGFVPPYGSTWVIMEYDSKIGNFSSITGTGGLCGLDVAVGETAIVARVGLVGDTDNDRDVDLTDLSRLLAEFGCQGGIEFPCPIDFDFNGDTDLTDLSLLLTNFGLTCP